MDPTTLAVYDAEAAIFARQWHDQPEPSDLHALVEQYFVRGGTTADIGCGAGREVEWLNDAGFPAAGFDASEGLLAEARSRHPELSFARAELPELATIAAGRFDNVLCETVVMHLPRGEIGAAVRRLMDIVKPDGVLYLSWRVSDADTRDEKGRLYSAFPASLVTAELAAASIFVDDEVTSASSGKIIHRIVAKKPGLPPRE